MAGRGGATAKDGLGTESVAREVAESLPAWSLRAFEGSENRPEMARGHRKTSGSGILGFGNQCSGDNRKKWEAAGSSARRILQSFTHESMASTVWSHSRKIQVGRGRHTHAWGKETTQHISPGKTQAVE